MDSYDDILQRMKDKYAQLSGQQVPELSDIDIRMKVLAGEIYNDEVNLEFIKRQMFAQSATGEYLDLHAADRGLSRKAEVKAKGTVSFYIPVAVENNITVPKGTVVATEGAYAHRFITDYDAVITAGRTSVSVSCTAEKGGRAGNIAGGTVSVIVTSVSGVESVSNSAEFKGGADCESDENLRKRILQSYVTISNGTNAAYYRRLALSVDGVTGANVVPRIRGVGTVDVYICSHQSKASDSLVAKVQELMDDQRELNVDVSVYSANTFNIDLALSIKVKDGYDFNEVKASVEKEVSDYIASLSIGESIPETHLCRAILGAEGVYDYEWDSGSETSFTLPVDVFPVLNTLSVGEVAE